MKKSIRFILQGSVQPRFFNQYIKEQADKCKVRGYVRTLSDQKTEIFIEGDIDAVEKMTPICKRGPQHSLIRSIQEKAERFQDFKDFKIIGF